MSKHGEQTDRTETDPDYICDMCDGSGRIGTRSCPYCAGTGSLRPDGASRAMSEAASTEEPFPQPKRKPGGEPCGECHIQPGETCDICGAVNPPYVVRGKWVDPLPPDPARGPRTHPYGPEAYLIANVETGEVRIYPTRDDAMAWALS